MKSNIIDIMQNCFRYMCLAALVAFFSSQGYAQRNQGVLSGIVYDSATRAPMPYVSVLNKATNAGTVSTDNGTFTIGCAPGDSIVFTMVGYAPGKQVADSNAGPMVVFLAESTVALQAVTVYGSFKPQGSEQWKTSNTMPQVFVNPTLGLRSGYNIQTFGPGISLTGLMSRMSKSEKERRKVVAIREKNRKSEVYTEMIMSEETKSFFKKTFSMSEDDYHTFVERFNISHPEAARLENKEEIKNLMVIFKATNK